MRYSGARDFDDGFPSDWTVDPAVAALQGLADNLVESPFPSTWSEEGRAGGSGPVLQELPQYSEEFRVVERHFLERAVQTGPGLAASTPHRQAFRVESVLRVEHTGLRSLYLARRDMVLRQCAGAMDRLGPAKAERWVFHGPRDSRPGEVDAMGSILEEGFRPLLSGSRTGAMYGHGEFLEPAESHWLV